MSTVIARVLAVAFARLLAGCATAPITIDKGGDGHGNDLLRHKDASVQCHGETVSACRFTNTYVPWGDRMMHPWFMVVDGGHATGFTPCHLERIVHEASHDVAAEHGITPDATHNEDHGVIACAT